MKLWAEDNLLRIQSKRRSLSSTLASNLTSVPERFIIMKMKLTMKFVKLMINLVNVQFTLNNLKIKLPKLLFK